MEHHDHDHEKMMAETNKSFLSQVKEYYPLFVILTFCALLSIIHKVSNTHASVMYLFMGYFFIFLSMFKFFDLSGFVDGFSTYDLITKRVRVYGYLYPFFELSLGLAYIAHYHLLVINVFTVILMLVSAIGVIQSLVFSNRKITCACLGTVLNVPLTAVAVVENLGMGVMALYALLSGLYMIN